MKPGTKVKTPDGKGVVIKPIGRPIDSSKPILVRLDKMIEMYHNFYYSKDEIKAL